MSKLRVLLGFASIFGFMILSVWSATIDIGEKPLVTYQSEPLENPKGGDKFKGSNFIHPLKTPSGFIVTGSEPLDHRHHFGLWWPWKHVNHEGKDVNFWELQDGEGLIEAKEWEPVSNGLLARSIYTDRKAEGGAKLIINETTQITSPAYIESPVEGYLLDLEITQVNALDKPITVTAYRYSGFSLRATQVWNADNSTILTSEGYKRYQANFTKARWVRVEGDAERSESAGILLMSHPDNQNHPEKLRTWDVQHNGMVFVNFNTVGDEDWVFEPGIEYTRKYRLFVYDGNLTSHVAERMWQSYADSLEK